MALLQVEIEARGPNLTGADPCNGGGSHNRKCALQSVKDTVHRPSRSDLCYGGATATVALWVKVDLNPECIGTVHREHRGSRRSSGKRGGRVLKSDTPNGR